MSANGNAELLNTPFACGVADCGPLAAAERIGALQQRLADAILNAVDDAVAVRRCLETLREHFGALGAAYYCATAADAAEPVATDGFEAPPASVVAEHLADAVFTGAAMAAWRGGDGGALWSRSIGAEPAPGGSAVLVAMSADAPADSASRAALESGGVFLKIADEILANHHQLQAATERFASLTRSIPGVVYQRVVKPCGEIRYTYISESAEELFGVPAQEILDNPKALFNSYAPEYAESFRKRLIEASKTLTTWDVEASIIMPDGSKKYTHAIARPQRQSDGSVLWTGVILNASRIKDAERAAAEAESRTRLAIVESLAQGFLLFDHEDRLALSNSHFLKLYPHLADVARPGAFYETIVAAENRCGYGEYRSEAAMQSRMRERLAQHAHRKDFVSERRLGDEHWVQINEHRAADGGTVVLYTDISEIRKREARIHHMALHDALTGLPNRVLFRERIETALAEAGCYGFQVGVLCIDLDNFKNVNDTLGHPAGDQLLCKAVTRLKACVRDTDVVARLGGDEFAVVLADICDQDYIQKVAARIIKAMNEAFDLDGQQAVVGASIGVSVSGAEMSDPDVLMKCADLALYRAKADGKNSYRFFEKSMDELAQARRLLEVDLRTAIEESRLELYFQPQVTAVTEEIRGFEALVRWNHPRRGRVPPSEFIEIAEETGLIIPLGDWVLEKACTVAAGWPEQITIAVNMSPAQFKRRDLPEFVAATLKRTGLPASRLELEITETVLLRNTSEVLSTLYRLKGLGVRIAMDDFGTGYSSLGNLRSFPFDKIKIDRSFVSDLNLTSEASAIVKAVVSLGNTLGIETTAEGVETLEQLSYLRTEGCSQIQGFYYSKARPALEIDEMLRNGVFIAPARTIVEE